MGKIKVIFLAVFTVLVTSCTKSTNPPGTQLYVPTSADVTATASLDELAEGRTLYIANCGRCHNLFSPDDYSVSGWKSILPVMGQRAMMSASQISLITKYLTRGK